MNTKYGLTQEQAKEAIDAIRQERGQALDKDQEIENLTIELNAMNDNLQALQRDHFILKKEVVKLMRAGGINFFEGARMKRLIGMVQELTEKLRGQQ